MAAPAPRTVVVGTGPCGLFAGLVLAQMGFRPIVLERGKAVRERTVDTFGLWRKKVLNPESNVQFGEGGAGTFSDGKLYSQIKDPNHYGRKVLEEFVKAGAPEEILYVSKPHIGTFRLTGQIVIDSVRNALDVGYRAIDTAQIYGNEAEVCQAIAESGVPRDELFLTTKIWVDNDAADKLMYSAKRNGRDRVESLGLARAGEPAAMPAAA